MIPQLYFQLAKHRIFFDFPNVLSHKGTSLVGDIVEYGGELEGTGGENLQPFCTSNIVTIVKIHPGFKGLICFRLDC